MIPESFGKARQRLGWWASLAWVIVAAIGWSRIHTGAHTKAQVAAGIVVGAFSAWPPLLFV